MQKMPIVFVKKNFLLGVLLLAQKGVKYENRVNIPSDFELTFTKS